MNSKTLLSYLAQAIVARRNCEKSNNAEWRDKWETAINRLADFLPHGSGFDCGTKVDLDRSNGRALIVLTTQFHHMNDGGMYVGWTQHVVKITPCLHSGFDLHISGRDRNDIKSYISDTFAAALDLKLVLMPDGEYILANSATFKID